MFYNIGMRRSCFMCGLSNAWMFKVKLSYSVHGLDCICKACGAKADVFVNYTGAKRKSDLINLKQFFNSGVVATDKFNQLSNAGYY